MFDFMFDLLLENNFSSIAVNIATNSYDLVERSAISAITWDRYDIPIFFIRLKLIKIFRVECLDRSNRLYKLLFRMFG
jgi:hypothetical protein